jgi:hypothetical protein
LGRKRAEGCGVDVRQVFPIGAAVNARDIEKASSTRKGANFYILNLRKTRPGVDTPCDSDRHEQSEPLQEPPVFYDLDAVARTNAHDVFKKVWHLCPPIH